MQLKQMKNNINKITQNTKRKGYRNAVSNSTDS